MTDVVREYVFFSIAGLMIMIGAIGWYHFYVAPQDAALTKIMVCMDGDRSYEAYDRCSVH